MASPKNPVLPISPDGELVAAAKDLWPGRARNRLVIIDSDMSFALAVLEQFPSTDWEKRIGGADAFPGTICQGATHVLVDVCPHGTLRLDLMRAIRRLNPHCFVCGTASYPSLAVGVATMKAGAHECIAKPIDPVEIYRSMLGSDISRALSGLGLPTLARMEWEYISRVLIQCSNNLSRAAKLLGIQRSTLQRKLRKNPPLR